MAGASGSRTPRYRCLVYPYPLHRLYRARTLEGLCGKNPHKIQRGEVAERLNAAV